MAENLGRQLLAEVETTTLDELLATARTQHAQDTNHPPRRTCIEPLDALWATQPALALSIHGVNFGLPLLYHVISTAVAAGNDQCVLVVDTTALFDVTMLTCSFEELRHVHVYQYTPVSSMGSAGAGVAMESVDGSTRGAEPTNNNAPAASHAQPTPLNAREALDALVSQLRTQMLYGSHASRDREFLGVVTIGMGSSKADIVCNWRGRVRVEDERTEVVAFGAGISAEEAWAERDVRWKEVVGRGWRGVEVGRGGQILRWL